MPAATLRPWEGAAASAAHVQGTSGGRGHALGGDHGGGANYGTRSWLKWLPGTQRTVHEAPRGIIAEWSGRLDFNKMVLIYAGRFLVRIFILVWAPRGLIGPGFGLPWPAGGQVGWPSRWKPLGRPDGPSAACRRRRHVRFPLVGAWGWFPQKRVPSMALVPPHRARRARFSGIKNSEGT